MHGPCRQACAQKLDELRALHCVRTAVLCRPPQGIAEWRERNDQIRSHLTRTRRLWKNDARQPLGEQHLEMLRICSRCGQLQHAGSWLRMPVFEAALEMSDPGLTHPKKFLELLQNGLQGTEQRFVALHFIRQFAMTPKSLTR